MSVGVSLQHRSCQLGEGLGARQRAIVGGGSREHEELSGGGDLDIGGGGDLFEAGGFHHFAQRLVVFVKGRGQGSGILRTDHAIGDTRLEQTTECGGIRLHATNEGVQQRFARPALHPPELTLDHSLQTFGFVAIEGPGLEAEFGANVGEGHGFGEGDLVDFQTVGVVAHVAAGDTAVGTLGVARGHGRGGTWSHGLRVARDGGDCQPRHAQGLTMAGEGCTLGKVEQS